MTRMPIGGQVEHANTLAPVTERGFVAEFQPPTSWFFVDHEVQVVATLVNVKGYASTPATRDLRSEHLTRW